jgi:HK97 family phage major capsid protein
MEAMNADFVEGIGDALINGNDNRRPRGLLSYSTVKEANWKWGSLAYTPTGAAAGFAAENAGDALINTLYSLKTPYLGNATWLMNRSTLAEIRKMKDGQGNYLWQPSFQIGQPDTLLGYGLRLDSKMPNLGAGATPIAFGDFRRGYLVVRRSGMTLIRDQYTQKPYVVFSTRMRLAGGFQNFEAIKLLKCAA